MTACTATPTKSSRDDEPSDFSTAKSRSRSSAETYMSAATMIAATTHIGARECVDRGDGVLHGVHGVGLDLLGR